MSNRIISCDLGKGWVKVVSSTNCLAYRSVISPESQSIDFSSPFDTDQRFKIGIDGNQYAIGDSVYTDGRVAIHSADRNRIETDFYKILFASAMAGAIGQSATLEAVVSLPPIAYWDRQAQKETLAGVYKIEVPQGNGKIRTLTYDIPIENIRVIPEGMGTILTIALDEKGRQPTDDRPGANGELSPKDRSNALFNTAVGVIDIGSGTVDLLGFDRLRLIQRMTDTDPRLGVAKTILPAIKNHASKNGRDLASWELDKILRDGYYLMGDRVNIKKVIDHEAYIQGQAIAGFISDLWDGGNAVEIMIVTGGGANLCFDYLRDQFGKDRVFLADGDTQLANAVGGYRYGLLKQAKR